VATQRHGKVLPLDGRIILIIPLVQPVHSLATIQQRILTVGHAASGATRDQHRPVTVLHECRPSLSAIVARLRRSDARPQPDQVLDVSLMARDWGEYLAPPCPLLRDQGRADIPDRLLPQTFITNNAAFSNLPLADFELRL